MACLCMVLSLPGPEIFAESAQSIKAPSNLAANLAGPRQVDLVWVDNSSNETGFRLERSLGKDFREELTVFNIDPNRGAGGSVYLSDHTVMPDLTYYYRVFGLDREVKSAPSNPVQISTVEPPTPVIQGLIAPPSAPTNLKASAVSSSEIDLNWVGNTPDATSYQIERSPDVAFTSIFHIVLPSDSVTFSDTGVVPLMTYYYRVHAVTAGGNSAASNVVSVTTPAAQIAALAVPAPSLPSPQLTDPVFFSAPDAAPAASPEIVNPVPPPVSQADQNSALSGFKLTALQKIILVVIGVVGVILAAVKVSLGRRQKVPAHK